MPDDSRFRLVPSAARLGDTAGPKRGGIRSGLLVLDTAKVEAGWQVAQPVPALSNSALPRAADAVIGLGLAATGAAT